MCLLMLSDNRIKNQYIFVLVIDAIWYIMMYALLCGCWHIVFLPLYQIIIIENLNMVRQGSS